ncbi:basic proline-rich protein-like [Colius striatus]|uniref:basic proline-rich protein-like n=1 Tax=Colius striatus TaxID=57412 RepID=UPI002B1E82A5|nr:basic proline-rich protein-like [Colius striatus]
MLGRSRHRHRHRALMGRRQVGNPRDRWHPPPVTAKSPPPSKAEPIPGRGPRPAPRRARPRRDGTDGQENPGQFRAAPSPGRRDGSGTGGIGTPQPCAVHRSRGQRGARARRDPQKSPAAPRIPPHPPAFPRIPRIPPQPPQPPHPPHPPQPPIPPHPPQPPAAPRIPRSPCIPRSPRSPAPLPAGPGCAARGTAIAAAPTGRLRRFPLRPPGLPPAFPGTVPHAPARGRARGYTRPARGVVFPPPWGWRGERGRGPVGLGITGCCPWDTM